VPSHHHAPSRNTTNHPAPAPKINRCDSETDSPKPQGVSLSVRGLCKSYGGIKALKGIAFDLNPGEIFVILGPSGCGKPVLLRQAPLFPQTLHRLRPNHDKPMPHSKPKSTGNPPAEPEDYLWI